MIGLYGGAFDPPHNGHVALAQRAKDVFALGDLHVLVAAAPGHKSVVAPADVRLELARAAFPDDEVTLDDHPRTIETLRAHPEWVDPVFLIGADQFCDFLSWREPAEVLRRTRLGIATRPGYPPERLRTVLDALDDSARVLFFELEPLPIASRDLRARIAAGESVDGLVPPAVHALIERDGLYRAEARLH
jgi:nicotinate-nucleotide adenylyltransferase